jgi:eukaryotic-like serine/threonine-protein kinase
MSPGVPSIRSRPSAGVSPEAGNSQGTTQHEETSRSAGPTPSLPSAIPALAPPRIPLPEVPARVGGYEILDLIGRGGMGVVYRARQVALERIVALKMILSGSHADEVELARFRAEAAALARLRHPHIVQVYEVGECDGRPFFSMEYVDGGSLSARLREQSLPPEDAARLVEALARRCTRRTWPGWSTATSSRQTFCSRQ